MLSSLVTTVATPVEMAGAAVLALQAAADAADRDRRGKSAAGRPRRPAGRTCSRRRARRRAPRRGPRRAGYMSRSAASSNWVGLTNSETTTTSHDLDGRVASARGGPRAGRPSSPPARSCVRRGAAGPARRAARRPCGSSSCAAPPAPPARARVTLTRLVEERERARARAPPTAARWRATVCSSPRATGPVRARSGPRRPQFSTVARTSGSSISRSMPVPAASCSAARLERDQEVGGDRGRGVVGDAVLGRRSAPPAGRARRRARGRRRGSRGVLPATAAPAPVSGAGCPSPVKVISGCSENAGWGARTSRPQAPEQCPTARPGATLAAAAAIWPSGTHSSTISASEASAPRPSGPVTRRPAAENAAASVVPAVRGPTRRRGRRGRAQGRVRRVRSSSRIRRYRSVR